MAKIEVSQETLQQIINYLQERPYHEVYKLIEIILKEVNDNKEE